MFRPLHYVRRRLWCEIIALRLARARLSFRRPGILRSGRDAGHPIPFRACERGGSENTEGTEEQGGDGAAGDGKMEIGRGGRVARYGC